MLTSLTLLASLTLAQTKRNANPHAQPLHAPPRAADSWQPDAAWKPLGHDLWFDPKAKQVVLRLAFASLMVPSNISSA